MKCSTEVGHSEFQERRSLHFPKREAGSFIPCVSNSIYKIAKESEEIPIQYAPARTVGGSLKFHF